MVSGAHLQQDDRRTLSVHITMDAEGADILNKSDSEVVRGHNVFELVPTLFF